MKNLVVLLLMCGGVIFIKCYGAPNVPTLGSEIVDHHFKDVAYFRTKSVFIHELRGKWVVLDMWGRHCASCVIGLPKLNEIQRDLGDNVQVLLIGANYSFVTTAERKAHPGWNGNDYLRTLYTRFRRTMGIDLPIAYDTTLYEKLSGQGFPLTIVLDPHGVIKALTSGITKQQLVALMAGQSPPMIKYPFDDKDLGYPSYNVEMPYLASGGWSNGGVDTSYMFREVFGKVDDRMHLPANFLFKGGDFELTNMSLASLYKIAYSGYWSWTYGDSALYGNLAGAIRYETADSAEIELGQHYCYSLVVDKRGGDIFNDETPEERLLLEDFLRKKLEMLFPYQVSVEQRPVEIMELVVTDSAKVRKLTAKGGRPMVHVSADEVNFRNTPMAEVAGRILENTIFHSRYVEDRTGILTNVNIHFAALGGSFDDINRGLANNGLQIRSSIKTMKQIVVKGPRN